MQIKSKDVTIQLNKPLTEIMGTRYGLLDVTPLYDYENGKKSDKQIGYSYEIVLLDKKYVKVKVKILDTKIDNTKFENVSEEDIPVTFKDLHAKVYTKTINNFTSYNLTLTASNISIAKDVNLKVGG